MDNFWIGFILGMMAGAALVAPVAIIGYRVWMIHDALRWKAPRVPSWFSNMFKLRIH